MKKMIYLAIALLLMIPTLFLLGCSTVGHQQTSVDPAYSEALIRTAPENLSSPVLECAGTPYCVTGGPRGQGGLMGRLDKEPAALERLKRLEKENRTLRMERDFLKKAAAFFAEDTKRSS